MSSACPSTYLLTRAWPGQGPRATGCLGGPASTSWGLEVALEVVTRLPSTHAPYRQVTVAQRWTERPGPLAVFGPRAYPAAPNPLPFRDRLEVCSLTRPILLQGAQPWPTGTQLQTALGSDGQVDRQTNRPPAVGGVLAPCVPSRLAGGSVPVSALSCHATSHVLKLGLPLPHCRETRCH